MKKEKGLYIEALIVCVDYTDCLSLTIENNIKHFDSITVITSTKDEKTKKLCSDYGVNCLETDLFYSNGDVFNKGRAINYGLKKAKRDGWICILDADISLPVDFRKILHLSLNRKDVLYGIRRRIFDTEWDLLRGIGQIDKSGWYEDRFLIRGLPTPEKNGLEWGESNPFKILGYLQIFHSDNEYMYSESYHNAAESDIIFSNKFSHRSFLPSEAAHLGKMKLNWNGKTNYFLGLNSFQKRILRLERLNKDNVIISIFFKSFLKFERLIKSIMSLERVKNVVRSLTDRLSKFLDKN